MGLSSSLLSVSELSTGSIATWDRLAVESGKPHSAPAWALGWWRHVRPSGARDAVIVVRDGSELVGILPLYTQGRRYHPFGLGLISVEPLAVPGREREVAAALAEALDAIRPRPVGVTMESADDAADWGALISASWPGNRLPYRQRLRTSPTPRLHLDGIDFDQWFAAKSANFRRDIRRKAKRIRQDGGESRLADLDSLDADVRSFLQLHRHRHPKGSALDEPGVEAMLREVGTELLPADRFRLALLEVDGSPDAALLMSSAGDHVSAWNSGMGEVLARHSPMMQLFVEQIEGMQGRGERSMDLGPGDYDYKQRLADSVGELRTEVLVPPGAGHLWRRSAHLIGSGLAGFGRRARRRAGALSRALKASRGGGNRPS